MVDVSGFSLMARLASDKIRAARSGSPTPSSACRSRSARSVRRWSSMRRTCAARSRARVCLLARHLIRWRVPAGAVVFEQAVADRFYVIAFSAPPQLLRTMGRATRRASERLRRSSLRTELHSAGERRTAVRTRQLRSSLSNAAADPADPALLKRRSVVSAAQVA